MRITSIDILIMPFIKACQVHNLVDGPLPRGDGVGYVTRFSTCSKKLRSSDRERERERHNHAYLHWHTRRMRDIKYTPTRHTLP